MYFTAQDVVDHLLSVTGGGAQDAEQRDIRSAVHHAYRDVVNARDWAWHVTQGRLMLEPAETLTATIGGSGTTVTRASGSWPTGAASYRVYTSGVVAQVATRTSDTVLTLSSSMKFPAGFDGSKSVTVYRNTYPLPADFRNMDALVTQDRAGITSYVTPTEWSRIERSILLSGDPVYWTVMRDESSTIPDRWSVRVCGYPTAAETLDFTYRRKTTPLRYTGYETAARAGEFSCSASTSVTGSNSGFKSDMVGCVFRAIDSSVNYPEPLSGVYPFAEQSVIDSVSSTTALALKDALTGTYSNNKYVITSLLDISEGMFSAVLSGAEMWLSRLRREGYERAAGAFAADLRLALETDVMSPISGRVGAYHTNPAPSRVAQIKAATVGEDVG